MVFKPAEQTPLSSLALAGILQEAGLPDGVLNVVVTSRAAEVVEPLLRSGRIRKLSFTGSTEVGRILLGQCADTVVRTSMELGGNAPFIVFDDADLDVAVDGRDGGQDAQHGRGMHGREPLLRAHRRGRRVQPSGWPSGWARCGSAPARVTASTSAR